MTKTGANLGILPRKVTLHIFACYCTNTGQSVPWGLNVCRVCVTLAACWFSIAFILLQEPVRRGKGCIWCMGPYKKGISYVVVLHTYTLFLSRLHFFDHVGFQIRGTFKNNDKSLYCYARLNTDEGSLNFFFFHATAFNRNISSGKLIQPWNIIYGVANFNPIFQSLYWIFF